MKTLLLIPLLMIPYLVYMRIRYGMTVSISATAKHHTSIWESVWFSLSLWAVGIPLMLVGFVLSNPEQTLVLWLLAGGLICLIGAAQVFWRGGMEYKAHMIGSYGGIGSGMLALLLHCTSFVTVALVGLFAVFTAVQMLPISKMDKYKLNNRIYWVEVAAIATAQLALYFK
nr:hypothetical protein [uncultured Draconibacterium sp.]